MTVISVIVGSTREGVDARLLDQRDFPMPFFDQPRTPAMPGRPPYKNDVVQRWTAAIAETDGVIFVTPEYMAPPRFSRTRSTGSIGSGIARRRVS